MTLVCPHCRYDGSTPPSHGGTAAFYFLEDIVVHRDVVGLNAGGPLIVDGLYRTGEGYDDGTNPRLECRNCLRDFAVPATGLPIEWR